MAFYQFNQPPYHQYNPTQAYTGGKLEFTPQVYDGPSVKGPRIHHGSPSIHGNQISFKEYARPIPEDPFLKDHYEPRYAEDLSYQNLPDYAAKVVHDDYNDPHYARDLAYRPTRVDYPYINDYNGPHYARDLAYRPTRVDYPYINDYYDPICDRDAIVRERQKILKKRLETALYRGGYALNGKNVYSPAYPY